MKVRRRRPRGSVEIGALISDLAFLLIIFFMVIALVTLESGLRLALPRAGDEAAAPQEAVLSVSVGPRGAFGVAGAPVSREELRRRVEAFRNRETNMVLLARVAPEAPYQAVVELVDIAREQDVENFSFSMEGE
ncbi:MAG: ExbD/TolR family protein [Alkalispirochaetaceae bacterium]